jgi:hypothetical protein
MIIGLAQVNFEDVILTILSSLFILLMVIAGIRYIVASGSTRRINEARGFITTTIQRASISLGSMIIVLILGTIITSGVISIGVIFIAINVVGIFLNSAAAAIAAVATAIYTLLTCWLIMETRRARRVQEAAVRAQEAAIKAQEATAKSDGDATTHIAASLDRIAQALERQQEATRLDTRPLSGSVPANGGLSHDGKPSVKIVAILHKYIGETVRRSRGDEGEGAHGSGNGK